MVGGKCSTENHEAGCDANKRYHFRGELHVSLTLLRHTNNAPPIAPPIEPSPPPSIEPSEPIIPPSSPPTPTTAEPATPSCQIALPGDTVPVPTDPPTREYAPTTDFDTICGKIDIPEGGLTIELGSIDHFRK
jgi:hypothetical protein